MLIEQYNPQGARKQRGRRGCLSFHKLFSYDLRTMNLHDTRRSYRRLSIGPALAAVLILSLASCSAPARDSAAAGGVLDVSGVDLGDLLALDGEWEFYWNRFVDPDSFMSGRQPQPNLMASFPSEWASYPIPGVAVRGFGTWRLRILGLEPLALYGLSASSFLSAGRIFANGVLIDSHGTPGRTESEERPGWMSHVSTLRADSDGSIDLVLHVSNFADRSGGLRTSLFLGHPDDVWAHKVGSIAYELFVVGAILAMGAYYLGLFMFRHGDRASLWFGLLCLVLGVRVLFYDEYFILAIFPGMSFRALFVLGYLTFTAGAVIVTAFVRASFPDELPQWGVWFAGGASAAYTGIILFTSSFFASGVLRWYQLSVVLVGLGIAAAIVLAAVRRKRGAGLFGLGFLAIFAATIYDMFVAGGLVQGVFITQLGMMAFLLALSLNMTRLFAGAFTMAERLTGDLRRVNESLERFVPREFLGFLKKSNIEEIELGDHSAEDMAVLFADVRAFTWMAENLTPEETFTFINEYLARTGPAVRAHGGFIDKYLGDGFMALFPAGAESAVRCAIDIQARVRAYNVERAGQGRDSIAVGIGVHVGTLMLGTIGESARMDGTVISDVVNTASRLEGVAKEYAMGIAASESVFSALQDPTLFRMRFIGRVRVKNKRQPVSVFEIYDGDEAEMIERKERVKDEFERGVEAYYGRRFDEARQHLVAVAEALPDDKPTRRYLDGIARHGSEPKDLN
ncbi:MAG: adenylate/guanylate cyclase domain-containing protein [Spirochaetales bacterium]|nr:MAG: adenylate/guanylate cyclase domain-containing protein [Spirochaetales bacterium]